MPTGRLEAFSDGVFAIAITLLVLEIPLPSVEHGGLVDALLDEWPAYAVCPTGRSSPFQQLLAKSSAATS